MELPQQRVALAKHEEDDQQREQERGDAPRRLAADDPTPFGHRLDVCARKGTALVLEIRVQPVRDRWADHPPADDPARRLAPLLASFSLPAVDFPNSPYPFADAASH